MSDDISLETLAAYAGTAASADLSQLKPGKIDITIHADGQWSYRGSVFQRKAMVALLAQSLIIKDQAYYLIAPEQLLKIRVEDLPFRIIDINKREVPAANTASSPADTGEKNHRQNQTIELISDLGHSVTLDAQTSFELSAVPNTDVIIPCVHVTRGLYARLSRGCFYQLVAWGESALVEGREAMRIFSGGVSHILGFLD